MAEHVYNFNTQEGEARGSGSATWWALNLRATTKDEKTPKIIKEEEKECFPHPLGSRPGFYSPFCDEQPGCERVRGLKYLVMTWPQTSREAKPLRITAGMTFLTSLHFTEGHSGQASRTLLAICWLWPILAAPWLCYATKEKVSSDCFVFYWTFENDIQKLLCLLWVCLAWVLNMSGPEKNKVWASNQRSEPSEKWPLLLVFLPFFFLRADGKSIENHTQLFSCSGV